MKKSYFLLIILNFNIIYGQITHLNIFDYEIIENNFSNIKNNKGTTIEFDYENGIKYINRDQSIIIDNKSHITDAVISNFHSEIIYVRSGWKDNIVCFSLEDYIIKWTITIGPGGNNISQNKTGEQLIIADRDNGNIYLLNTTNNTINVIDKYRKFGFTSGFLNNGLKYSIGTSDYNDELKHELRIYDKDNNIISSINPKLSYYNPDLTEYHCDYNNNRIIINSGYSEIYTYEINNTEIIKEKSSLSGELIDLFISNNRTYFATYYNKNINIYDDTLKMIQIIKNPNIKDGMSITNILNTSDLLKVYVAYNKR